MAAELAGILHSRVSSRDDRVNVHLLLVVPLVAALPLACSGPTTPSEANPVVVNRIAVLGDSLAVSPSKAESFPAVLEERIEKARLPWKVTNAGVRGDTTTGGLRRLDDVLSENPAILILALGANDGLRGVDTATISKNLSEIIRRAKARGVRVLLCGMETPPLRGWAYTLAFHRIFPALAREHDVPLVPFLLAGVALDPEMNMEDMIHPNPAGAKRIADTIWPYLEPMLKGSSVGAGR
jgi:acyl-CoA thioesterase I